MTKTPEAGPDFSRVWRFLKTLGREYHASGAHDSAASLTYTTLFAVVPVMTVAFAILKLMPQLAGVSDRIEALVFENFVPSTGAQIKEYLVAFSAQASSLTGLGIGILLVTSLLMLLTIERAFNRIWRVHRARRLLSSLLVYWALLTLGPLLLGIGLAAASYVFSAPVVSDTFGRFGLLHDVLIFLPFVLGAIFLSLVYVVVPNCNVPVRDGIVGGVVASFLMEIARHAFTYFVTGFSSYELVYGAFAAVPLFLLWIYISWVITLFGVVLVYVLANWDDDEVRQASMFPALLKVLALFRTRQREGRVVTDAEARHVARQSGIDNWHDLREKLLARGIVERSENGGLLLICDLHAMRLADVARLLTWRQMLGAPASAVAVGKMDAREPDAFSQLAADELHEAVAAFDARLNDSVAGLLDRLSQKTGET